MLTKILSKKWFSSYFSQNTGILLHTEPIYTKAIEWFSLKFKQIGIFNHKMWVVPISCHSNQFEIFLRFGLPHLIVDFISRFKSEKWDFTGLEPTTHLPLT